MSFRTIQPARVAAFTFTLWAVYAVATQRWAALLMTAAIVSVFWAMLDYTIADATEAGRGAERLAQRRRREAAYRALVQQTRDSFPDVG